MVSPGMGQPQWVYCMPKRSFHARQVMSKAEDNLKPSTLSSLDYELNKWLSHLEIKQHIRTGQ